MHDKSPLFKRTIALVSEIPEGKVLSYGQVAILISAEGCARHVSYILSSSSKKYKLPWQRVLSSTGKISVHRAYRKQIVLLKKEGVLVNNDKVDLEEFGWKPSRAVVKKILKGLPLHVSVYER